MLLKKKKKKMEKVIKLTEQDLVRLVKKIIKEDVKGYLTTATVEDDMVIEFYVNSFNITLSGVYMMITEVSTGKKYYVKSVSGYFGGPIYDRVTKKIVFTDSYFGEITPKNYKQIAKQNNIPVNQTK